MCSSACSQVTERAVIWALLLECWPPGCHQRGHKGPQGALRGAACVCEEGRPSRTMTRAQTTVSSGTNELKRLMTNPEKGKGTGQEKGGNVQEGRQRPR